jgi:hypothetical protein
MNRAQRRKMSKGKKKKQQGVEGIMDLFDKIPNQCLVCEKSYDKKNKEMVRTWNVVVRNKEQKVNLYCPQCWATAQKIIRDFKEERG